MLRIVDRHVLRQVATPLGTALTIGLVMLLADRMVHLLDTALGKKNSFGIVFEMMAYLVPNYLGTAIPAAVFLGLLFGFSRMSAASETDAFLAAGIGLHRLAQPVIVLSVFFAVVSLLISGWVQPYARYAYRAIVFNLVNVEAFYLAEEGVFMQAGTRTFVLDRLNRSVSSFDHVFIYDDKGKGGSDTITATTGQLVDVPGETRPVLHLDNGHRLTFKTPPDPAQGVAAAPEVAEFEVANAPLGRIGKDVFRPRGDDEWELTLAELFAMRDSPPRNTTRVAIIAEIHKRLVDTAGLLILPFLALPFAVGGRRQQRGYRFGLALVLVVAVHEIIGQGSNAAHMGASPWLTMWLPLGLLGAFAGWSYYNTCFTLNPDPLNTAVDRAGETLTGMRQGLMRRLSWARKP
jgi:lipopolysaccharide export system permease protein